MKKENDHVYLDKVLDEQNGIFVNKTRGASSIPQTQIPKRYVFSTSVAAFPGKIQKKPRAP
jgi:hypothetical protein